MPRSQISPLIQMRSIGISNATPVDSPCHPEELALSARLRATLAERHAGSADARTLPLLGDSPTSMVCECPLCARSGHQAPANDYHPGRGAIAQHV